MKRRDQILFIRDYGNHIISKSDFYKMLGVQTIYISYNHMVDTRKLNKIHEKIKVKDLSKSSLDEFVDSLGCDDYISKSLLEIKDKGSFETFGDFYDSAQYSSIIFLNYQGNVFASEKFCHDEFSSADKAFFDHICENGISDISKIYIKNWS